MRLKTVRLLCWIIVGAVICCILLQAFLTGQLQKALLVAMLLLLAALAVLCVGFLRCPYCGGQIQLTGMKYCPSCGKKIKE